jgi:hypothetical protein
MLKVGLGPAQILEEIARQLGVVMPSMEITAVLNAEC